jgi:hypothetical protein
MFNWFWFYSILIDFVIFNKELMMIDGCDSTFGLLIIGKFNVAIGIALDIRNGYFFVLLNLIFVLELVSFLILGN